MKRIAFLMSAICLSGMVFFSSCSKDDNSTPGDLTPTLTFQVGAGYTTASTTVNAGSDLKFGIRAMENSSSGANLTSFTLSRTINGNTQTKDTTFNASTFNVDFITTASTLVGNETFLFTVKDKDGYSKTLTVIITTTATAGDINTFSMKILGAQGSATGSSFASIDGTVYTLANAKANATSIDWLYYYGATDAATLAAPNDAHAALVYNSATNGLQTWTKLNASKFKVITDAVDFDAITNDAVIVAQTASGVTETRIAALTSGKLLAFIAESGKKGILRIDDISGTDAGTITISVKVQK